MDKDAAEVVTFAEEIRTDFAIADVRRTGAVSWTPTDGASESAVRQAHCPILVVDEQEFTGYGERV